MLRGRGGEAGSPEAGWPAGLANQSAPVSVRDPSSKNRVESNRNTQCWPLASVCLSAHTYILHTQTIFRTSNRPVNQRLPLQATSPQDLQPSLECRHERAESERNGKETLSGAKTDEGEYLPALPRGPGGG